MALKMRQIYIILLFITVLASCQSRDNSTYLNSNAELEKAFQKLSEQVLTDSNRVTFRLDSLTNFEWDSVLVLTPYTPIKDLEKSTELNLAELYNTKITVTEGSNVLAFINHKNLVNFVDLSALYGNFDHYDSIRYYIPSTAVFEMELTDQKFVGGQRIVKVKPIVESNSFMKWR